MLLSYEERVASKANCLQISTALNSAIKQVKILKIYLLLSK
ncbi:hypothetical protein GM3709_2471 [Geminocystis sp. NIES-3709]|nr:hypothetical protein GM3709_2471 [Geminocystis sp. NIES-3709]